MRRLLALLLLLASPAWGQGITSSFPGPGTPHSVSGTAIAFDNASTPLSMGDNGGSGNYSHSFTGATLTHGLMVVCITGSSGSDSNPAPTYNSAAMTLGTKIFDTGTRWVYLYYLLNPASGAHTLAITQTGGDYLIPVVAEYSGVKQTAQPDATATNTGSDPLATSITIANANSWSVACAESFNGLNTSSGGTGATYRVWDGVYGASALFDSNAALSAGSYSMTVTNGSVGSHSIGVAITSFQPG